MARFALSSPDAAVRLDAVREMMRSLDEPTVALLRERVGVETDAGVKKEIATGLALAALDGRDAERALDAIATLQQQRQPGCAEPAGGAAREIADGSFAESDAAGAAGGRGGGRSHRSAGARSTPASRRCSSA